MPQLGLQQSKAVEVNVFIDGAWVESNSGKTFDVTNPATGDLLGTVPDGDGTILTAGHHHTIIKSETEIIKVWVRINTN